MNINVKAVLIALAVYIGLGWIVKDIFFSVFKVSGDTTLNEIYNYEIWIYAVISAIYNFFIGRDDVNDGWIEENIQLDKEDNPMKESIAYTIVEKESGLAVGSVGCSYYEDEKQVGLVYFVGAEYRGKGYASEAARAYAKYFLEHYEIPLLVVHIRNANKASCKTAEKAGFALIDTRMYQDYGDEAEKLYNFYEMRR